MKQKIVALSFSLVFFPLAVFAADWWGGGTVDSEGNYSISVGVGSGAGGFALNNPYGLPGGSIFGIISNFLFWLLAVFAIFGIIGFVVSGIIYLVSTGDENTISRAKTAMLYSILGIIVGLSGFVIIKAVASLLSGASNRF